MGLSPGPLQCWSVARLMFLRAVSSHRRKHDHAMWKYASTLSKVISADALQIDNARTHQFFCLLPHRTDQACSKQLPISQFPHRRIFFCLDAAWLSGFVVRAVAFYQLQLSENVATLLDICSKKSNKVKNEKEQHQLRRSLPESAGGRVKVACSFGRLD